MAFVRPDTNMVWGMPQPVIHAPDVGDGGGGGGDWLLSGGVWNDAGVWDDASVWKDAA